MFCMKLNVNRDIFIVLFVFQVCLAQRRIKNGQPLTEEKRYMVYLIRASASPQAYDAWLCGGALVTARSIITAAACLEDVKYMYAIAGYRKYVTLEKLNHNECTKEAKKKVVITCVPKRYDFAYEKIERWSSIDIGIAKVESDFDFTKTVGKCTYPPSKVRVNFDEKWQIPGLDAFVLGWGHSQKWREVDDSNDYNQDVLHFTTTLIIRKEECKKEYSNTPTLYDIIDRYMICADGPGNINPQGEVINEAPRVSEGCDPSRRYRRPESCEDEYGRPFKPRKPYPASERSGPQGPAYGQPSYGQPNPPGYGQQYSQQYGSPDPAVYGQQYGPPTPYGQPYGQPNAVPHGQPYPPQWESPYKSRRDGGNSIKVNADLYSTNEAFDQNTTFWRNDGNVSHKTERATRRHGICQNDHGGPLVTWVGSKEYLIGVASVFRIDENRDCTGPYLYTSTQCNAAFLDCVLKEDRDWGGKPEDATSQVREALKGKFAPTDATTTNTTHRPDRVAYFRGYSRKEFCDLPPAEKGFDMVRRQISWVDHPDGPADNELTQHDLENLEMRPQIPIGAFAGR